MERHLSNPSIKTDRSSELGNTNRAMLNTAFQHRLLASLVRMEADGDKLSVAGMLRDASMLFAETLLADRYLAISLNSDDGTLEYEFGPPKSVPSAEVIVRKISMAEVPSGLRHAITSSESAVVADWQEGLPNSGKPLGDIGIPCALFCPVIYDSSILGLLGVCSDNTRNFGVAEILFGESLAQVVSASYTSHCVLSALEESDLNRSNQLECLRKETIEIKQQLANFHKKLDCAPAKPLQGMQSTSPSQANVFRSDERRASPRRSYPFHQLIAPIIGGRLPDRGAFHEVTCRDIGAQGLSFLVKEPPRYRQCVIALGSPPSFRFLAANVVHVTPIEQNGQPLYIVGCRYLSEVEL
ncbi:MAG: GAF domain-containing protein [Pirellulales bacterium]|nr:GAF domain-containing protein [Pirellulales bacterium]